LLFVPGYSDQLVNVEVYLPAIPGVPNDFRDPFMRATNAVGDWNTEAFARESYKTKITSAPSNSQMAVLS